VISTAILSHTLPKTPSKMKLISKLIIIVCMIMTLNDAAAQDQQTRIDSLVNLLKTAGREWNDYSKPLISIGEPAVPALIKVVKDRNLSQWIRRISVMTLNSIHSSQWVKPALSILFDRDEDPVLRNHVTAGLRGFDLSKEKEDLWEVYLEVTNESYKSNLANLLLTADTSMAYKAFNELYTTCDGHIQQLALLNLVRIRPEESSSWFIKGIQVDDWMTANLAMDSLVTSIYFIADDLISVYHEPGVREEVQWRIIFVFGHRKEPESLPMLVEALQEESWLIHTEAAEDLCRFDPEQVIPEMKALKNDTRPYIRNNSRWVIHQMK